MKSLSPLFSLQPPKTPYPISSTNFRSFPFIRAAVQTPQRPKPSANKRPLKPSKTICPAPVTSPPSSTPAKKVLVPMGFGTEEMEVVIMVDVMRRAGAEVTLASVEEQLVVETSGGTRLLADTSISACSDENFDLVALPGGMPGAARLRDSKILQDIMSKQVEAKRLYGAICAAPAVTLLPWGLLKRKQTTCHPAFLDKLPRFWAVKSNIQVSGELTTSQGAGTSFQFALSLVDQLFGESIAKEIGESMLLRVADNESRKKEFNEVPWSLDHTPQVLVPVANGCEEIEVVTIVDILRRAKVNVTIASVERSSKILASRTTTIVADKMISATAESVYDLIILPGGISGTERLQKSRVLKKLLKEQELAGRILGALCSSSTILQKQGLLKDKRITANPIMESNLQNEVYGARVVIDGKLITCKGFATATDFALAIVGKLFGHGRARSVAEGLVFEYPSG